jgi:hypothetical protein
MEHSKQKMFPRSRPVRVFIIASLLILLFICFIPAFVKLFFVGLPERGPAYDCDDAALFMYEKLERLHVPVTAFVGDLTASGEKFRDINHIWLMVNIAGIKLPLDGGSLLLDAQHFEGYPVSYDQLLAFVEQDKHNTANQNVAGNLDSTLNVK